MVSVFYVAERQIKPNFAFFDDSGICEDAVFARVPTPENWRVVACENKTQSIAVRCFKHWMKKNWFEFKTRSHVRWKCNIPIAATTQFACIHTMGPRVFTEKWFMSAVVIRVSIIIDYSNTTAPARARTIHKRIMFTNRVNWHEANRKRGTKRGEMSLQKKVRWCTVAKRWVAFIIVYTPIQRNEKK